MESKAWYKSRGVWGGVITAVIGIITLFAADLGAALGGEAEAITDAAMGLVELFGGVLALVGRIGAKGRIKAPGAAGVLLWLVVLSVAVAGCAGPQGVTLTGEYYDTISDLSGACHNLSKKCTTGEATPEQCAIGFEVVGDCLDAVLAESRGEEMPTNGQ